jgi:hypothetical protein
MAVRKKTPPPSGFPRKIYEGDELLQKIQPNQTINHADALRTISGASDFSQFGPNSWNNLTSHSHRNSLGTSDNRFVFVNRV